MPVFIKGLLLLFLRFASVMPQGLARLASSGGRAALRFGHPALCRLHRALPPSPAPQLSAAAMLGSVRGAKGAAKRVRQVQPPLDAGEEEGVYVGEVTQLMGKLMEVKLADGRVVKAKLAGKLAYFRTPIRLGHTVQVQYSLDMDEEDQVPAIVARPREVSEKRS